MRAVSRLSTLVLAAASLAASAHGAPPAAAPPAGAPTATPAPAAPLPPKFTAPEYVMGSPRAKVTLTEYASVACPHCAKFDAQVFPALKAKYVDTGKIRFALREMLVGDDGMVQVAAAGFMLARLHRPGPLFRRGRGYVPRPGHHLHHRPAEAVPGRHRQGPRAGRGAGAGLPGRQDCARRPERAGGRCGEGAPRGRHAHLLRQRQEAGRARQGARPRPVRRRDPTPAEGPAE